MFWCKDWLDLKPNGSEHLEIWSPQGRIEDLPLHNQHPATPAKLLKKVQNLTSTFQELHNPFKRDSNDLFMLDMAEVVGMS